jgi:hypothetical protein
MTNAHRILSTDIPACWRPQAGAGRILDPKQLIFELERQLLPDYCFHGERITKSDARYEFAIEIRPWKRRLTYQQSSSQPTPHSGSVIGVRHTHE